MRLGSTEIIAVVKRVTFFEPQCMSTH